MLQSVIGGGLIVGLLAVELPECHIAQQEVFQLADTADHTGTTVPASQSLGVLCNDLWEMKNKTALEPNRPQEGKVHPTLLEIALPS